MTMSQFSWHHLNQWSIGIEPLAIMAVALALYVGAARRTSWPLSRSVYFVTGLVITFVATQSVVGVYDMEYFSDHMVQHLLLIMLAAPVFALSAPLDLAYAVGPARLRAILDSRAMDVITHPIFAFALYFAFIPLTHLTGLMNVTMGHEWIHHSEQVAFLVVGYLFFRVAFGIERGVTLHPGLRLVYVMAAVPVDTFTGLALAMSSHNPYPAYSSMSPPGSTPASVLAQVKLGGAIMWIGGDALMLLACIPIAIAWVKWETVKTRELDAILDAQGI